MQLPVTHLPTPRHLYDDIRTPGVAAEKTEQQNQGWGVSELN